MTGLLSSLSLLVHGESGTGKTWLGDTTPAPRLVLDVEGRTKFTPSRKTLWEPARSGPPALDGTWETCVVPIRAYEDVGRAFQWLNAGGHPFQSLVLDSVSMLQARCKASVAGTRALTEQDWGTLLNEMAGTCQDLIDLTMHPTTPLRVVMFTSAVAEKGKATAVRRPDLQGQMGSKIPYLFDVVGYLYTEAGEDNVLSRKLLIQPYPGFVAKDGTDRLTQHYGAAIPITKDGNTIARMLDVLAGHEEGK